MAHEPRTHIVLVGAMGAGKTTIGRRLAAALGRPFVDNDAQLERATGATAAQLAERDGVDALHHDEAETLIRTLRDPRAAVIAAAASSVTDPTVRRTLARGPFVVWLRADPATLAARMPSVDTRPFADVDPGRVVAEQARERDPLFAALADLTVETSAGDPDATVATILNASEKARAERAD